MKYIIVYSSPGCRLATALNQPIGPTLGGWEEAEGFRAYLRGREPTQEALDAWRSELRAARDHRADFAAEHGLEVCEEHGAPVYYRESECGWSEGNCPVCWASELAEMSSYSNSEASKSLADNRRKVEQQAARVPSLEDDLKAEKVRAEIRERTLRDRIRELEDSVDHYREQAARPASGWR